MTSNQLQYHANKEIARANAAREALQAEQNRETNRSNVAKELETHRSNVTRETETERSNLSNEALKLMSHQEDVRSNLARENETNRHNRYMEGIETANTVIKGVKTAGDLAGNLINPAKGVSTAFRNVPTTSDDRRRRG